MRMNTRNELGGTLVLYTVAMMAMMGMGALAIDLGMLRKSKAEAQRAADAAALAGASAFLADLTVAQESTNAVSLAYKVADTNYMNGVKFDTTSEVTVWVIPDSVKVRVRARRAAVPTWFASLFGINSFPVGAVAAAEASYASGAKCVKPIALPDLWDDGDNDTNGNEIPDDGEQWLWTLANDTYHPAHWDSDSDGTPNDGAGTGLGSNLRNSSPPAPFAYRDWGRQVVLRPPVNPSDPPVSGPSEPCAGSLQGNKCYVPGWWGWWGGNPKTMEQMILGCDEEVRSVGEVITYEGGEIAKLFKAIETIYGLDAGASWAPGVPDSVTGALGTVVGSTFGNSWRASRRVWIVAMMPPSEVPLTPPDKQVVFNNFMEFFLEGCLDKDFIGPIDGTCGVQDLIVGRFLGAAKGTSVGPSPGTMVRILRLVE